MILFFSEQSSDSSDSKGSGETRAATTAAENVKSFVAGGFGGVAAVLVGVCISTFCLKTLIHSIQQATPSI